MEEVARYLSPEFVKQSLSGEIKNYKKVIDILKTTEPRLVNLK